MVNSELFIKRLEKILNFYQFSASAFADKIGVQRSSMSHLLSGRNKPSLDFVMKITTEFEDVDLYWLLYGKGDFPKSQNHSTPSTQINTIASKAVLEEKDTASPNLNTEQKKSPPIELSGESNIERIVFFYTNGTFKTYKQEF